MDQRNKYSRALLRSKYDSTYFYDKVEAILDTVSKEEFSSWYQHDCTQALLLSLEGDLAGIVSLWINGGYADKENVDGTAQLQATALGRAQSIDEIIETIHELRDGRLEGESIESA